MRVTLIFPAIGITGFGNTDYYSGEVSWINHGLASIGAVLKRDGHEVSLIDMRRLSGWEEFDKTITEKSPELVGINVSAMDLKISLNAIERIRNIFPYTRIAVGGIQPTMFSDKFIANENIDFIVKGEGEIAMSKIANGYSNGRVIECEKPNLDSLPFIDRDLFDYQLEMDNPFIYGIQKKPMVTMLAGRGCPHHCAFCQPAENSVFGSPYRLRSVDNVISELDILKSRYDFKSVLFWDDTFTISQKWVNEFCDKYKFGDDLIVNSRADIICKHPEMVERLASVGLDTMLIGFESGSQRMLDFMEKGTTVDQNYESAEICRKYGVKIFGTFMIGLPGEKKADAMLTRAMIGGINPENKLIFVFTPIPGTKLYNYCVERDLLLEQDYTDIARTGVRKKRIKGVDYRMLFNMVNTG